MTRVTDRPLTSRERSCLLTIIGGPLYVISISTRTGQSHSAVASRMRRLEDRGLVRRAGTWDNNSIKWELTEAGRNKL